MPRYLGKAKTPPDLSQHHTRILAEIVDAYRIGLDALLSRAAYYRKSGADFVDLGCLSSGGVPGVGEAVAAHSHGRRPYVPVGGLDQSGHLLDVDVRVAALGYAEAKKSAPYLRCLILSATSLHALAGISTTEFSPSGTSSRTTLSSARRTEAISKAWPGSTYRKTSARLVVGMGRMSMVTTLRPSGVAPWVARSTGMQGDAR